MAEIPTRRSASTAGWMRGRISAPVRLAWESMRTREKRPLLIMAASGMVRESSLHRVRAVRHRCLKERGKRAGERWANGFSRDGPRETRHFRLVTDGGDHKHHSHEAEACKYHGDHRGSRA